jgi:multidrug efflux pump subunit AcrA (membrane-fusion protein)
MRFVLRSLTGFVLAVITVGVLLLAARLVGDAAADRAADGGGPPERQEQVLAANVIPVVAATQTPYLTAYGEVRAIRQLDMRTARGGTVTALSPNMVDGGTVALGEVLVQLDPAEATAARDLAAAALAEAQGEAQTADADLVLARDDLAAAKRQAELRAQSLVRAQDIAALGSGSAVAVEEAQLAASGAEQAVLSRRQALIQAEARIATTASAVERARIQLDEAERALAETQITAAFGGRLSGVSVIAGMVVGPNERLASLIDPTALEVAVRLSTAQFMQLTGGKALPVAPVDIVTGGPSSLPAHLTRAAASVGEGQTGRLVFATLDTPGVLQPGDFVEVRIAEPPLPATALLPATAVGGDGTVLVVGTDDRLEAVAVTVLRRLGNDVIVDPGAAAGREIVAERSPLLGAGIRIAPVRGADRAGATVPTGG